MPTEDKRRGKILPIPVIPPDTVCFTIQIPNAAAYRAAFLGLISQLEDWHHWDHPIDGTICTDCEAAAALWRKAIYEATWSDECGGNMSCEDVANCIENDPNVQQAIEEQIANSPVLSDIINNYTNNYGSPLTQGQMTAPIATAEDCDRDSLFGSVSAVVDQLNANNLDFLQAMILTDQGRERLAWALEAIPILGELPIGDVLEFVNKIQNEIMLSYEASYTTALRDTYRCDLFCIAFNSPDCTLTFEAMLNYFDDRLGAFLDPDNLMQALAQYVISGTWAGTLVSDIMHLIQLGVWSQASTWTGITLRTLQTVGLLGANDPDPDWEIICDPCSDPVEDCFDLRNAAYGWYPSNSAGQPAEGAWGEWISGQGLAPTTYFGTIHQFYFTRTPTEGIIKGVTLTFNQAVTNVRIGTQSGASYTYSGDPASVVTFDTNSHVGFEMDLSLPIFLTFSDTLAPTGTFRVQEVCYEPQ